MFVNQLSSTYHQAKSAQTNNKCAGQIWIRYIVEKIGIIMPGGIIREKPELTDKLTTPQKVVMMLQELGPTFIKLGQLFKHLSLDIIPENYIENSKGSKMMWHLSI